MSTAETPATGARRRRDPDRGAKILAAARTLFYERGFHAVSVDEIGEAAGATGAAIYRHFSGKEEILSTLFDEALDQYLVALPDAGEEPRAALASLVRGHLRFTIAHREAGSLWAHEHRALTGDRERRLARRSRQYVDQWVLVLRRVHPQLEDEDLYAAALAAIGTTTSLVSRPGHDVTPREADVVAGLLIAGLLALDTLPGRI